MQLNRDQVNTILKNAPTGVDKTKILDGLIQRGYELEGVDSSVVLANIKKKTMGMGAADTTQPEIPNEKKPQEQKIITEETPLSRAKDTLGDIKDIGTGFYADVMDRQKKMEEATQAQARGEQGGLRTYLQIVGQVAGIATDGIGQAFKGATKLVLSPSGEEKVKEIVSALGEQVVEKNKKEIMAITNWYDSLDEKHQRDLDAVGGVVNLASNFIGAGAASATAKAGKGAIDTAIDTTKFAIKSATNTISEQAGKATDTILSAGRKTIDAINAPDVSDAAKVSLNPAEALKGTGQDIMVSVKTTGKDGKNVLTLKKLSELTPEEKKLVQVDTAKNLDEFTKQAELFKNDRAVADGSPVEVVGKRTDQALELADKERQSIGSQMGEIEQKYLNQSLAVGEKTDETLTKIFERFKTSKFGVGSGGETYAKKLVADIGTLRKGGSTIEERLQFVRDWQQYLRDARDAFGNFKENGTINSQIEKAVNTIRDETVAHISDIDKGYKTLRQQYAQYTKLQDIGDSLLGKDGALGERIKGAATVKRAIQSNSDAGARQFLAKLKEVTGYDAIKEGDIALTAMENVGDYQGLSLLNILNEGKSGIIRRGLEKVQDLTVGSKAERAKKYIKK